MDKQGFVHQRKKRYMAQVLELFEQDIEPHLPPGVAGPFKGFVRQKLNALAIDASEIISLKPGEELNGAVVELRDHLQAPSRPQRSTTA